MPVLLPGLAQHVLQCQDHSKSSIHINGMNEYAL